jgi:hypothetical protein
MGGKQGDDNWERLRHAESDIRYANEILSAAAFAVRKTPNLQFDLSVMH